MMTDTPVNYGNPGNPGGYSAYKQTQQKNEDYRVTEANALLRCASMMEEVKKPETPYMEYAEAIRHNQNLWTVFQAALVDIDNPLPTQLKETLKGLSVYVDRRTLRALADQNGELLNVLININKEIAGGLMDSYNKDLADLRAKQESGKEGNTGSASGSDEPAAPPKPRINTQIF